MSELKTEAATEERTIHVGSKAGRATHRALEDQEEWRSVCGFRRDMVQGREGYGPSFHYLRIHESRKHRHHRATEFCIAMAGAGEIVLDETPVTMKTGDVVVVPPRTWHTYRPDPKDPFHLMIVVNPGMRAEEHDIEFWEEQEPAG